MIFAQEKQLNLFLVGFNQFERKFINGICNLSRTRIPERVNAANWFNPIESSNQVIDIILIDSELQGSATIQQQLQESQPEAIQIRVVSGEAIRSENESGYDTLPRTKLGGHLLRYLDEAAGFIFQRSAAHKKAQLLRSRCLVIDDSHLARTQMEIILDDCGVLSQCAEDAESGIRLANQEQFDLIFLDVMLPEMDGYQACKILKADPRTCDIPVVMLTSKRSPFNRMHGARVGCNRYLTKPIKSETVQKVLQRYSVIADPVNYAGLAGAA